MQQTGSEVDVQEPSTSAAVEVAETQAADILQDLQAFQPDIQMADVEEWLNDAVVSETTDEDPLDGKIIALVEKNVPADKEDDMDEDECVNDDLVSHWAAKDACQVLLKYIEQHPIATPMDVLWAKKWREASAKSRLAKLKQKDY